MTVTMMMTVITMMTMIPTMTIKNYTNRKVSVLPTNTIDTRASM